MNQRKENKSTKSGRERPIFKKSCRQVEKTEWNERQRTEEVYCRDGSDIRPTNQLHRRLLRARRQPSRPPWSRKCAWKFLRFSLSTTNGTLSHHAQTNPTLLENDSSIVPTWYVSRKMDTEEMLLNPGSCELTTQPKSHRSGNSIMQLTQLIII